MAQPNAWAERKVELAEAPYPHMKVANESAFAPKPMIDITAYMDDYSAVVVKIKIGALETAVNLTRIQARELASALVDAVREAERREEVEKRIAAETAAIP